VQAKRERLSTDDSARVHEAAKVGIGGTSGALPHLDKIQKSFGPHDVTSVVAHTGAQATAGAQAMGAAAFTMGNHVAFAGSADLHTAAHEAAHVVQQRAGVQLTSGVGEVGDPYEREADRVADAVVQGRSAQTILTRGPHAAARASSASSTEGGDAPVQRKVGFEIEAASVYSAKHKTKRSGFSGLLGRQTRIVDTGEPKKYDWSDIQGRDYLGDGELVDLQGKEFPFESLSKKDVILAGEGFKLEADEQNDGYKSNIEFVTSAFPETREGAQALANTMHTIVMLAEQITATAAKVQQSTGFIEVEELARFGTPTPGLLLIPALKFGGALQVTAAIRLDSIAFLMYNMAAPEGEDPSRTASMTHTRSALGTGIQGGARSQSPTAMAPFAAGAAVRRFKDTTAIDTIWNLYYKARKGGISFGSDELKSLLAVIVQYMRTAATRLPGYPKTIAPLMARTDFARIFSMVPESAYFKRDPDDFIRLVHMAVGTQYSMDDAMFTGGIYHGKSRLATQKNVLEKLSRRTWLADMTRGVDRLTAAHFNEDGREQPHLESLGSYGDKVETVGSGESQLDAPLFEIRSMGEVPLGMWYPRVMDVFLFLASLNSPQPNEYKDTIHDDNPTLVTKVTSRDQNTRLGALHRLTSLLDKKIKTVLR
jgi:hypothetical protein